MTLEEAVERLKRLKRSCRDLAAGMPEEPGWALHGMALDMAISALRPVSREQVEKIKGVWIFNDDWWEFRCSECHKSIGNIGTYKFCPHCGAPMTDGAVEMVIRRLEEMRNG